MLQLEVAEKFCSVSGKRGYGPYAAWAEQLYREGLVESCSDASLKFCPDDDFTLAEAARLTLRLKHGEKYVPPSLHQPVNQACSSPVSSWVEEFKNQGLLQG